MPLPWYVLHLRPRTEKKVAEHCARSGISHFLPLRSETKIYQRRKVTVEKPVFPGYLFVAMDRDGRLTVLKTNHVVRIMEPGSRRVLLHQLAQVRRALRVDPGLIAASGLRKGRRVRITGGPFMGIEGVISEMKGMTRVSLNVEIVGQSVAVVVDPGFLEAID